MGNAADHKVFLSYSRRDAGVANEITGALTGEGLQVWIDVEQIRPGARISDEITRGLKESDYYVLLISEDSNRSEWVKRELALAFDLSRAVKLTLVPVLLDSAPVPLELRGLLYLDFRASTSEGIRKLVDFFSSQFTRISLLEPRQLTRKADDDLGRQHRVCQDALRNLTLSDLRYMLSRRLTRQNVEVLWFDIFEARMIDEVTATDVSLCCVELLDRARREERIADLIDKICRNHPVLGRTAR